MTDVDPAFATAFRAQAEVVRGELVARLGDAVRELTDDGICPHVAATIVTFAATHAIADVIVTRRDPARIDEVLGNVVGILTTRACLAQVAGATIN